MADWISSLPAADPETFWDAFHARMYADDAPQLSLREARAAWKAHPLVAPARSWMETQPMWVESWLHRGPERGFDTLWLPLARTHPGVIWGTLPADQARWAAAVDVTSMGPATLDTWLDLAIVHPSPAQVSPLLRGAWVKAALWLLDETSGGNPDQDETHLPHPYQPWLARWLSMGVDVGEGLPPTEFVTAALKARIRAAVLEHASAPPIGHRRVRP